MKDARKAFNGPEYALILAVFAFCLFGAAVIEVKYCPDEYARQLVSDWIFTHGTLPAGDEPETIIPIWGFSYALRPFLVSILSALCMKVMSFLTSSQKLLLLASRMPNVIANTAL